MMRTALPLAAVLAAAVVAACGGGQESTPPAAPPPPPVAEAPAPPPPPPPPAETAAPTPPPAPPAAPGSGEWAKWSHDQKLAYMKAVVMPKMHDEFGGYDSAKFGEMKCATCHGAASTADGSFKMPNPTLPKLSIDPRGFKQLMATQPKMFEFMAKHVEPDMAALLGEPAFDPKTMKGFGCFDCHTKK